MTTFSKENKNNIIYLSFHSIYAKTSFISSVFILQIQSTLVSFTQPSRCYCTAVTVQSQDLFSLIWTNFKSSVNKDLLSITYIVIDNKITLSPLPQRVQGKHGITLVIQRHFHQSLMRSVFLKLFLCL